MSEAELQLKTTPPRAVRNAVSRRRLEHRWIEINDRTAIIVTAPQGYGKTTLLTQWRRNWLDRGAYVAWAALDAQDDRARFVNLLMYSMRAATGRDAFATAIDQNSLKSNSELDTLTTMLAEVALLARPTVVVLDDVHRMPQEAMRELLAYLLNNAPSNLHVLVGTRRPLELHLTDLVAKGQTAELDASDLRWALEESVEVLRARFGPRISLDDAVRLHDLTEGWPLGLQLAVTAIERAGDLHEVIGQLSARRGDIHRFFMESLLSRLPPREAAFFVRASILESVNADLAQAVTGDAEAARYLERVAEDSPVVTAGEGRNWLRLHSMARDFLLGQFDKLPAEERRACYERAAAWYAANRQLRDAAGHALSAGNNALAVRYASQCLLDIAREGRLAEARDWMRRLPASVMARDVHLQLTAAWITALGSDAAAAFALVERISRHPQFDMECGFEATIVTASAAIFRDQPGLVADALQGWEVAPPEATPLHLLSLANVRATLALHSGDVELVRRLLGSFVNAPRAPELALAFGFTDVLVSLSHLMDGNVAKVLSVLDLRLQAAEREMGRRSHVAAMLSAVLAAAQLIGGAPDAARAVLADRLDVIERAGMPDSVMLAYRVLATLALQDGEEARAIEILEALLELGASRDLPRVVMISLVEQVRLHALRNRAATATELLARAEALRPIFVQPTHAPFLWWYRLQRALAGGYAALASSDSAGAEASLRDVEALPARLQRQPMVLVARALLALVLHEQGRAEARPMLEEVLGIADLNGIRGYVAGAHPRLAGLLASGAVPAPAAGSAAPHAVARPGAGRPTGVRPAGGLLTPKEAQILAMLAGGRANKEIARAMDIGEQTVKWHLKNLFFKLNAASRKHAVDRARLLGLLED